MSITIDQSLEQRESRAEKITCLVWLSVVLLTYLFFILGHDDSISADLVWQITLLVAVMAPAFGLIAVLISLGRYSASLKYINTFLQVTLVSGAILFDGLAQGPAYAFSSMPPMAYALVPMITAFRLQPLLGLFAGVVSCFEFLFLYLFVLTPSPQLVSEIPSLGLSVTLMKAVVLLALGVASAIAARSLQDYFVNYGKAQEIRFRLARNFGRFVSREIVNQIEKSDDGAIQPSLHQAAIVFGDIRGFTQFSEERSPQETTRTLNEYFEIVCRVIESEGGMVNKFLGDGYLALFGVYSDESNPCDAAARAVVGIQQATAGRLRPLGLSTGAAANFGTVVAGEVGSSGRCEFTAIGQPVNLAARLESLNSALGTSFVASGSFVNKLESEMFKVSDCGDHTLKGVSDPVRVFEINTD